MDEPIRLVVGAVACGNETEPILPGGNIYLSDLEPKMQQRILQFEELVHQLRKQAKTCEWSPKASPCCTCGKPATYVEYGYEGETDWRCGQHARKSSAYGWTNHELDDNQTAIQAALAQAEAAF